MSEDRIQSAMRHFALPGTLTAVHPFKVGHINETYISVWNVSGSRKRFLHQMINRFVFRDVPAVMKNIERAIAHIKAKRGATTNETLTIVPSKEGALYVRDQDGEYWRTYEFLENTVSFEVCTSTLQAYEAAKVMGRFLTYLSDCDPSSYCETIPHFQNVPSRFSQFDQAIVADSEGRVSQVAREIAFAGARREIAGVVEALRASGAVPLRVTHSDPKFNNVLFAAPTADTSTIHGQGVAVVDLDTIMPGTMLYDFGDLARSVVIAAPEDEVALDRIAINEALFSALVKGYLESTAGILTSAEIDHLYLAPRLIALSLGVRFLTDYLNGDKYFKIHRLQHNLDRARAQFKIVEETERVEGWMRDTVARVRSELL